MISRIPDNAVQPSCMLSIACALMKLKTEQEICDFFVDLLTPSEIETLSKRWRLLQMLSQGKSQRDIAKELGISLCKITRGAKILKKDDGIVLKLMKRKEF